MKVSLHLLSVQRFRVGVETSPRRWLLAPRVQAVLARVLPMRVVARSCSSNHWRKIRSLGRATWCFVQPAFAVDHRLVENHSCNENARHHAPPRLNVENGSIRHAPPINANVFHGRRLPFNAKVVSRAGVNEGQFRRQPRTYRGIDVDRSVACLVLWELNPLMVKFELSGMSLISRARISTPSS